jgi:hypothetical protein
MNLFREIVPKKYLLLDKFKSLVWSDYSRFEIYWGHELHCFLESLKYCENSKNRKVRSQLDNKVRSLDTEIVPWQSDVNAEHWFCTNFGKSCYYSFGQNNEGHYVIFDCFGEHYRFYYKGRDFLRLRVYYAYIFVLVKLPFCEEFNYLQLLNGSAYLNKFSFKKIEDSDLEIRGEIKIGGVKIISPTLPGRMAEQFCAMIILRWLIHKNLTTWLYFSVELPEVFFEGSDVYSDRLAFCYRVVLLRESGLDYQRCCELAKGDKFGFVKDFLQKHHADKADFVNFNRDQYNKWLISEFESSQENPTKRANIRELVYFMWADGRDLVGYAEKEAQLESALEDKFRHHFVEARGYKGKTFEALNVV